MLRKDPEQLLAQGSVAWGFEFEESFVLAQWLLLKK